MFNPKMRLCGALVITPNQKGPSYVSSVGAESDIKKKANLTRFIRGFDFVIKEFQREEWLSFVETTQGENPWRESVFLVPSLDLEKVFCKVGKFSL